MLPSLYKSLVVSSLIFMFLIANHSYVHALCIGIGCTCSVNSSGLNFGNYNPTNLSPLMVSSSITVGCTAAALNVRVGYTVTLSTGLSNIYIMRTMSNGKSLLNYNIFIDVGLSQIIGNGSGTSTSITDNYLITQLLTPYTLSYPVYGMIPAGQKVTAGAYTDTLMLTINF